MALPRATNKLNNGFRRYTGNTLGAYHYRPRAVAIAISTSGIFPVYLLKPWFNLYVTPFLRPDTTPVDTQKVPTQLHVGNSGMQFGMFLLCPFLPMVHWDRMDRGNSGLGSGTVCDVPTLSLPSHGTLGWNGQYCRYGEWDRTE